MCFFVYMQGCINKYNILYIYTNMHIYYIYMYVYMEGMRVHRYGNNNHLSRTKIKEIVRTLYT